MIRVDIYFLYLFLSFLYTRKLHEGSKVATQIEVKIFLFSKEWPLNFLLYKNTLQYALVITVQNLTYTMTRGDCMNKVWVYVKSILVPVVVGGVVGLIISLFMDYEMLQKPPLAPPSIVFPIMWTILYILMGISYGILKSNNKIDDEINFVYYLQLGVNALWSFFFFVFKWRLFSFLWILLLAILVIIMIIKFYKKEKTAGLIQIPYILWVLFASYLNLAFYILNR